MEDAMADDKLMKELLSRKFDPVTDWRPAKQTSLAGRLRSTVGETMGDAQKRMEALEKALEPLTDEAKTRMREAASLVEEAASKSSKEARTFLSKALQTLADKVKPE
jgi:hypothetical protein